jgi:hypothetical protein
MARKSGRPTRSSIARPSVFLNVPYDSRFESLFLAYIAGVSAFGMTPRTTLEIPGSERRLDRIFELIGACPYSIHDLSRVQMDRKAPATPRSTCRLSWDWPWRMRNRAAIMPGLSLRPWIAASPSRFPTSTGLTFTYIGAK